MRDISVWFGLTVLGTAIGAVVVSGPAEAYGPTTTRVSVSSTGAQANNGSYQAAISANGRHISYSSDASNLVPDDTNNTSDVFVRDRGRSSGCG